MLVSRSVPRLAILGTRGIPARYGGFETFAESLAEGLVRCGCDVTVFCEETGGESPSSYKGINLVYVWTPRLGALSTIAFDLLCLLKAWSTYDVVYMLGYGAAPFCIIPRLLGRKVWINMDGVEWRRSKWSAVGRLYLRMMERIAVAVASRLIADATAIKAHLEQRYGTLEKCDVIAYGAHVVEPVDSRDLNDYAGLIPGDYYLVVCRLEPENHVREIVEGYLLSGSAHPLVIVGGIADQTVYVRQLLSLASDRVRFVGAIYDQHALSMMRYNAGAYIHGHSVGGTNPSLLEAMGAGNLVIAHDNQFNREVLGSIGRYFVDPAELSNAIGEVDRLGPEARGRISAAVRDRIRSAYSWDQIVHAHWKLVQSDCLRGASS